MKGRTMLRFVARLNFMVVGKRVGREGCGEGRYVGGGGGWYAGGGGGMCIQGRRGW